MIWWWLAVWCASGFTLGLWMATVTHRAEKQRAADYARWRKAMWDEAARRDDDE